MSPGHLTTTLKKAAYVSIPNHRATKEVKTATRRIWNTVVNNTLKNCKETWLQWRRCDEPTDKDHPLVLGHKSKREHRKSQRRTVARKTMKEEKSIMSSDCSDKEFYQLAKQQRKTKDSSLQFPQVDDTILEL